MGAISVSQDKTLELIVFVAIMMHKAPTAFGLTSFLIERGLHVRQIQKQLAMFSVSAPLTAMLTYALLGANNIFASRSDLLGLCLLFSAGTFLFTIAAHILPELSNKGQEAEEGSVGMQGAGDGDHAHGQEHAGGIEWSRLAMMFVGVFIPVMLSSLHQHAH